MTQRVCPACRSSLTSFARARVLRRIDVDYLACNNCGLVCTESPHWLAEAYAQPIAATDLGLVARNRALVKPTALVLAVLAEGNGRFLDYGGGNGLFVRMMRDTGYDFCWLDPWTPNQFARGFEHRTGDRYEAVTAFEVFEHLPDPDQTMEELGALTDRIVFSTELIPASRPRPGEWWYYSLDSGQHVTLFTVKALTALAARHGFQFHSDGARLHLFSRQTRGSRWFPLLAKANVARCLQPLLARRPSLLPADYAALTGGRLEGG